MPTKQVEHAVDTPNLPSDAASRAPSHVVVWYKDLAPLVVLVVLQRMGKRDPNTGLATQQRIQKVVTLKCGRNEVDAELWEAVEQQRHETLTKLKDLGVVEVVTSGRVSRGMTQELGHMIATMRQGQAPYRPSEVFQRWGSDSDQSAARAPLAINMPGVTEIQATQRDVERGALGANPLLQG